VARILLIDDDESFSRELQALLTARGHSVRWLDSAEEALRAAPAGGFDLLLLDNKMPRMSGLEFLDAARQAGLGVPVVLMTGAHHDQTVIKAMSLGAFDYVIKPVDLERLLADLEPIIGAALDVDPCPPHVEIPEAPAEPVPESTIVGASKPMLKVLKDIARLARVDETVLILGETGTGKDLVARAIHTNSARRDGPFVVMNCAALSENLLEDELFGHEVAAWTGATKLRKGRFEHAAGGTLFLDEVGDMPAKLQVQLLRVLENREIVRVGGNDPIRVDVRVLAATNRDLSALVRAGQFRQELYFRLEGMLLTLPALRERGDDVELLARTFLARIFAGASARPSLHPLALERLRQYHWPGNVRQLQKVICRAAGSCRGAQILPAEIDFGELEPAPPTAPADPRAALRAVIAAAWPGHQGNVLPVLQDWLQRELLSFAEAKPGLSQVKRAEWVGVSRTHYRKLLEQYGLAAPAGEG
jgi:DNA-binding NtrC family response regulator